MQVGCEIPIGSGRGPCQGPIQLPTKVLEDIRTKVAASLEEVADLLCPEHKHRVTGAYLPPGVNATWYTLILPCGKNDIGWKLEMYPNCILRTVMRCKMVKLIEGSPAGGAAKFLQPRLVWGEALCNEMVDMIYRSDPAEKRWWLDEKLIKDNQPADTPPDPDEELYFDEPEVQSEAIQGEPQGGETATHTPGSGETLETRRTRPSIYDYDPYEDYDDSVSEFDWDTNSEGQGDMEAKGKGDMEAEDEGDMEAEDDRGSDAPEDATLNDVRSPDAYE